MKRKRNWPIWVGFIVAVRARPQQVVDAFNQSQAAGQ